MTTILPSARGPLDLLGEQLGVNLQQNLPGAIEKGYNRGLLQNSLDAIKSIAKDPNASPLDITLAAMKAGAGIPGSERYLSQIIPYLAKAAQSQREQNVQFPGEQGGSQRQPLPNFMQQAGQPQGPSQPPEFFPSNIGPQGGPGQAPQAATTGVKTPLRTRPQKIADAKDLAKQLTTSGNPTTFQEALAMINQDEDDKKLMNAEVDKELGQRKKSQTEYGQKAVDKLLKVHPEASKNDELQAIFKKKGEEASKSGDSEADIDRYLAKEANKYRNLIANVENDLSSPRLFNSIARAANGTYKSFEESAADVRKHLKPILDLGLYDTARKLLQEKGYGTEEREMILHPLGIQEQAIMSKVPSVKSIEGRNQYQKVDLNNIESALFEMQKSDPNFSIVLARKAFEDKGYNWREFKDALNKAESNGLQLSDDQYNQLTVLDTPPLSELEKILEGLNLIGR